MQKLILIIFLLTPAVFAQTAGQKVNNDTVKNPQNNPAEVACGQPNSNHSVTTLQVQDQDGLGTCYANQAALLIQNATNSSVPVSYQQIGMAHASLNESRDAGRLSRVDQTGRRTIVTEGGYGCKAFRAAKETGWCHSNEFRPFEYVEKEDVFGTQALVLKALSAFVDNNSANATAINEDGWKNAERYIAALLDVRNKECEDKSINLNQYTRRAVETFDTKLKNLKEAKCERTLCKIEDVEISMTESQRDAWITRVQQLKDASTENVPVGGLNLTEYPSLKAAFKSEMLNEFTKNPGPGNYSTATTNVLRAKNATLPALIPAFDDVMKPSNFYKAENDSNVVGTSCDSRWKMYDLIEGADILKAASTPVCFSPNLSSPSVEAMMSLAQELTQALRSSLTGSLNNRFSSVLQILAPACNQELNAGKKALENLRCHYISLRENDNGSHLGGDTRSENINSQNLGDPQKIRAAASRATLTALCAGKAVGVDVCTGFMTQDFAVDTNFCKISIPGIEGHGYHAMTIVGFKQNADGSSRFLVQNSWGNRCDADHAGTITNPATQKPKNIECEKVNGRSTGRFWVDEALIWNNTTNLNIIENKI